MIAVEGGAVACLGGWRGDRLFVARDGRELVPVADLGWNERAQLTPQRRLLLSGGTILVLEPRKGHLLLPPLRVRRFGLDGRALGEDEGEGTPGPALSFHARATGPRRTLVTRCGIDPASGAPTVAEEEIDADLPGSRGECSGTPLEAPDARFYPVRMRGLFRGAERVFEGDPTTPQILHGRVVCAGHRRGRPGVWDNGRWRPLPGPSLFVPGRAAPALALAALGAGLVALRREGGLLPGLDGPGGRLPPGLYGAILALPTGLFALAEEGEAPRLVPVER